ncbi:MAG TPA: hypothetical protein VG325_06480 [Solirubrobacteraceae bacterium]|nr:hypothetical protein [Solirubrobacteraceae bacterium]
MYLCCPAGHGCNDHEHRQACVLQVFEQAAPAIAEAATALTQWEAFRSADLHRVGASERRFRRRVYERARDQALATVAIEYATRALEGNACRRPAPHFRRARGAAARRVRVSPRGGESGGS